MKNLSSQLIGVVSILFLLPFRLPVNVVIIKLLTTIASVGTNMIPIQMLAINVMITKGVYNLILSILTLSSIVEYLKMKFPDTDPDNFYISIYMLGGIAMTIYLVYDCQSVLELTKILLK